MERLSNEIMWQILSYTVKPWSFPEEIPSHSTEVTRDLQSFASVCSRVSGYYFDITLTAGRVVARDCYMPDLAGGKDLEHSGVPAAFPLRCVFRFHASLDDAR